MAFVTTRPDSTVAAVGTLTGGATLHAVTNDTNPASYATYYAGQGIGKVSVAAPAKPAGSVTKNVRAVLDVSSISVNSTKIDAWLEYGGQVYSAVFGATFSSTTPANLILPYSVLGDLTGAQLGDVVVCWQRSPSGAVTNCRIIEAYFDTTFAEQPSVTATAPTAAGSSSTVTGTWTYTAGVDGGPQHWYHARVFSAAQYGAVGFNPATSTATATSGVVASAATSHGFVGLTPGTYRFYVAGAQEVITGQGHWSAWSYTDFTVTAGTTAEVLSVVPTPDDLSGSIQVVVNRDTAKDAWSSVELERNYDYNSLTNGEFSTGASGLGTDWVESTVNTPTSTSKSLQTTGGWNGQFQRIGATLDFGDFYRISTKFAALPGSLVRISVAVKGTLGANCKATVATQFTSDATLTTAQIVAGTSTTTEEYFGVTTVWSTFESLAWVPTDAVQGVVTVGIVGQTGAAAAVCTLDMDSVFLTQGGYGWNPVRGASTLVPAANSLTVLDFEAPPDRQVRYRARAIKAVGPVYGAWVYSPSLVEWTVEEGVWVKSVTNPNLNLHTTLAVPPAKTRRIRRGIHAPLGEAHRIVASDVRHSRNVEFVFQTPDATEADMLDVLSEEAVVLIDMPEVYRFPSGYFSLGDVEEVHLSRVGEMQWRRWKVDAVEVAAP